MFPTLEKAGKLIEPDDRAPGSARRGPQADRRHPRGRARRTSAAGGRAAAPRARGATIRASSACTPRTRPGKTPSSSRSTAASSARRARQAGRQVRGAGAQAAGRRRVRGLAAGTSRDLETGARHPRPGPFTPGEACDTHDRGDRHRRRGSACESGRTERRAWIIGHEGPSLAPACCAPGGAFPASRWRPALLGTSAACYEATPLRLTVLSRPRRRSTARAPPIRSSSTPLTCASTTSPAPISSTRRA